MLWLSETIDKDEITIAVYGCFAADTIFLLVALFCEEGIFDNAEHWDATDARFCLGGMNITVTAIGGMINNR